MAGLSSLTPATASYAIAVLGFGAFAAFLVIGWRGGAKAWLLLAAIGTSAAWAGLNLAYSVGGARWLWTAQAAGDALRVGAWLAFSAVMLQGRVAWWLGALLIVPVLLIFEPKASFGVMLALCVAGLVLMEQLFRRAPNDDVRWAVKPLCIGLGGGLAFDLYLYADALLFGRLNQDLWAARGVAQAFVIPFVALATGRNKNWTTDIAVSRGMLFHSTAFLACGIYLLAVAAAGYYVRYFGGTWGTVIQAGFVFAALLLLGWLFSSGALRARLRVFIDQNFFSYRYDYRREWLRFTGLLGERSASANALQRCIQALANLVESPAGALWLREHGAEYAPAARWNLPPVEARDQGSLPDFLLRTGWVIDVAEYLRDPARYAGLELPAWLRKLGAAWLVVPIPVQKELLGYVVLASPRAPLDVNWEVRDLLKTAARQVGSFVAETRASEALLEARKFEAFNKMSAFVVHDLKNLVAQLGLLLNNAQRHRHNPRFQEDMLSTVRHVSERMAKLLAQLSTGSRGEESLRPIDLAQLAERVAREKSDQRHDIAVETTQGILATGYEQRFERVLGHLVQNAIDATREGGTVNIGVLSENGQAVVRITDTGCGMSEQFVRERLFRPFHSTKPTGMGIGAFEAAQVVREMGGALKVFSRPGAGTCIDVILPLHIEPAAREAA